MKVSVSLPGEDVEFLDEYAKTQGFDSRSAVVHKAVGLLRAGELTDAYAAAWEEWSRDEAKDWEPTIGDGLTG